MIFSRSDRYKDNYQKLNDIIKQNVSKKLKLMAENPFHPSLRTKKIQGTQNIFEASIDMSISMTWQYTRDGILLRKNLT